MSTFMNGKRQNSSLNFRTYNNVLDPYNKKNAIYFRDTIKQFCPYQRFVDHRPYPIRSFVTPPIDFNYYNSPTEKDAYISCYKNFPKGDLLPLVTRQDFAKYIKNNGKLIKHQNPCNSCSKINEGNYGRNYYTIDHKSFPFINGNFTGTNFKSFNGFNTSYGGNRRRIRYKIRDYDNYQTNNEYNNEINNNRNNNEYYGNQTNDGNEGFKMDNNANSGTIVNETDSNIPKIKRRFHKTQIFNRYKPYMIDNFKEYADYE